MIRDIRKSDVPVDDQYVIRLNTVIIVTLLIFNPRPEGYGSRLVVRSFINPRPEGYGSRLVVRSFIHSVTWNCVHFYATTKA